MRDVRMLRSWVSLALILMLPGWALGQNEHWCSVGFETQTRGGNRSSDVTSLWVNSDNDVWAVGPDGAAHWDGKAWSTFLSGEAQFEGVWSAGAENAWLVGHGKAGLYHWNGKTLEPVATKGEREIFTSVWGSGPDDVWIGGEQVSHWDGKRWAEQPGLRGRVFGTAANDVWLVDDSASVRRWDGRGWSGARPGLSVDFISGGAGELVVAQRPGRNIPHHSMPGTPTPKPTPFALARWNGRVWSKPMNLDLGSLNLLPQAVRALWAGRPNETWALVCDPSANDDDCQLIQWTGSRRTLSVRASGQVLFGKRLADGSVDLWAGGVAGLVLHRTQARCPNAGCRASAECSQGLGCTSLRTCASFSVGAECGLRADCELGLVCREGRCAEPGKAGEACGTNPELKEKDLESGKGGLVSQDDDDCEKPLYCLNSALGEKGTCTPTVPEGGVCGEDASHRHVAAWGTECRDGRCIGFTINKTTQAVTPGRCRTQLSDQPCVPERAGTSTITGCEGSAVGFSPEAARRCVNGQCQPKPR